jgi:hypothetical protein
MTTHGHHNCQCSPLPQDLESDPAIISPLKPPQSQALHPELRNPADYDYYFQ